MYKPLQIEAPQTRNAKNLRLIAPPNINPRGLALGNCPQRQSDKTKQNRYGDINFCIFQRTYYYVCQIIAVRT